MENMTEPAALPPLPFTKKTKKYGTVTVVAIQRTDKGGLVQIDDEDHAPCWVRYKDIFGEEYFTARRA